ncbi:hypothetical protein SS05631_a48910 (plasmid) [Sinorhizobium sp. CCBAU 05631]|nr:hypothetical protein SS05631_a48910 [Sinorhizobium sp. CCBAU 05631]
MQSRSLPRAASKVCGRIVKPNVASCTAGPLIAVEDLSPWTSRGLCKSGTFGRDIRFLV